MHLMRTGMPQQKVCDTMWDVAVTAWAITHRDPCHEQPGTQTLPQQAKMTLFANQAIRGHHGHEWNILIAHPTWSIRFLTLILPQIPAPTLILARILITMIQAMRMKLSFLPGSANVKCKAPGKPGQEEKKKVRKTHRIRPCCPLPAQTAIPYEIITLWVCHQSKVQIASFVFDTSFDPSEHLESFKQNLKDSISHDVYKRLEEQSPSSLQPLRMRTNVIVSCANIIVLFSQLWLLQTKLMMTKIFSSIGCASVMQTTPAPTLLWTPHSPSGSNQKPCPRRLMSLMMSTGFSLWTRPEFHLFSSFVVWFLKTFMWVQCPSPALLRMPFGIKAFPIITPALVEYLSKIQGIDHKNNDNFACTLLTLLSMHSFYLQFIWLWEALDASKWGVSEMYELSGHPMRNSIWISHADCMEYRTRV